MRYVHTPRATRRYLAELASSRARVQPAPAPAQGAPPAAPAPLPPAALLAPAPQVPAARAGRGWAMMLAIFALLAVLGVVALARAQVSGAEATCEIADPPIHPATVGVGLEARPSSRMSSAPRAGSLSPWGHGLGAALLGLALALVFTRPQRAADGGPRVAPSGDARASHIAAESRTGPVRRRNEDRVEALTVGPFDALVMGDGLGGMPGGRAASELAVPAAARHLRRALRALPEDASSAAIEACAREALWRAARTLALFGARFDFDRREGLCTTILILVSSPLHHVAVHLGDGEIRVARADGSHVPLMEQQRGDASNIVAGCLGPAVVGVPEARAAERWPGDLAVVCTDGVSDRVRPSFYGELRDLSSRGDSGRAVAEALDALEAARDEDGPIANDNLTLGLIGDRERP